MFSVLAIVAVLTTQCIPAVLAIKLGNCTLPPYPENGYYTVEEPADQSNSTNPGDIVFSYVLNVTCGEGHQLVGLENPSCLQGLYSELPECIPICQWQTASTLSCGSQESTCYIDSLPKTNGRNSLRFQEQEECGIVPPPFVKVLAGGEPAQFQELPWHAGIYSKLFAPYMQICGGSLVSTTVVISAGHCFWDDLRKQLPAEEYAVAVGKIYRPWNDPHDELVQKSDVLEIKIPPRFLGSAANFQEDLALVVLREPVFFSRAVRPVCLNFDYDFDQYQLKNGSLGKVGGWGLRAQDGRASPTLQVTFIPTIDIAQCIAESEPSFRAFLSGDKICAGYTNGTAVCKGDSGGGLSFPADTAEGTRYYLRGVVSAAPQTDHLCSVYHWATFTHLLRHQHFIEAELGVKRVEPMMYANQKSSKVPLAKPGSVWVLE